MKNNPILKNSYKFLAIGLLLYAIIYGMLVEMPYNPIWGQSSRAIFYHVPMWFAMLVLMGISVWHSVRLLRALDPDAEINLNPLYLDIKAKEAARVGVFFNILGLLTGIVWSRVTWNENIPGNEFAAWWGWDPIQVCALVSLLIYAAYFLLRSSFSEDEARAKVSAVYNIFAASTLIPLFFVVPRVLEGLHPTAGKGSFIFKGGITTEIRMILYPGLIGFICLGIWLYNLRHRTGTLSMRIEEMLAERSYQKNQNNA